MSAVPYSYNPQGSVSPATILVVDDSQPTVRALAALLHGAEFETEVAYRGIDALECARSSPGRFAAAIIDIHLPDISGLVVSQQLRELFGPHVPIVVLSGDTSMQMLNALPHVGASYFFSKPVNSTQLLEHLKQGVGRSEQTSSREM